MTILQLAIYCAPNWVGGGPPRIMYDYACELAARGHKVIVLVPDKNRPPEGLVWPGFPPGVAVQYFKSYGGWRARYYCDYLRDDIEKLLEQYRDKVDIIHLAQSRSMLNVVALHFSRRYNIPVALSSFGSLPRRGGIAKLCFDYWYVYPQVKTARLLLGQTWHECEVYRRFGGSAAAIKLLPLAVDLRTQPPLRPDARALFRARIGLPHDSKIVLFLGRLHATKGLAFLVRCFAALHAQDPAPYFVIVGKDDGIEAQVRANVTELALDASVRFVGPLYDQERWLAYEAADVFAITPEIFEETSLASLEALACGTPVVTTTRADIPWLMEYGAGVVVPAADEAAMVSAMGRLLSEPAAALRARRTAALALMREKFSLTSSGADLERHFQMAIRAKKKNNRPLLIGPLLHEDWPVTGQAMCFQMLVDGCIERTLETDCVDISNRGSKTGVLSLSRMVEYVAIFITILEQCVNQRRVVYLTLAQSAHGFIRDLYVIIVGSIFGHKVVVHLHGGNYRNFYNTRSPAVRWCIRKSLRHVGKIIVLDEKLKNEFAFDEQLAPKVAIVRNSVLREPEFARLEKKTTGLSAGTLEILFLSNLIETKGYSEVLEVVAQLHHRHGVPVRATFCGNFIENKTDDLRVTSLRQAEALFENRVRELKIEPLVVRTGRIVGAAKERVLRAAHIMMLPTRYNNEGQPVALIEAMAYGIPAITTDYRSNPEIVLHGWTGYLVPWDACDTMAGYIRRLWADPDLYAAMSRQCIEHYIANFSRHTHLDAMEKVLFDF